MKTILCAILALLAAACVSQQESLTGTDPGPWLEGAAGRGPIDPGTYAYEDPNASLLWPEPLPPEALRGIEPDVTARGLALPGDEEGAGEFAEDFFDVGYDDWGVPYRGRNGWRRAFHRPRSRPGDVPPKRTGKDAKEPPRRAPSREAGPDAPTERRERVREAPDRPSRTDPRAPPRRPR